MITEHTSPAIRELPGPRRGPDDQIAGDQSADPLAAIAAVPAAEQDRLLQEHSEAVADHMANHFARQAPHLAARSGFASWQRAAGVAAALGAVALLVIIPSVLAIVLAGVIALITAAHLMIAVAARWRRRGSAGGGRAGAVPDADLPSYTILVPAYQEQDVIGGMVRCLDKLDYPKDRLEALILVERRDHATKQAIRDADPAPFIRIVEIPPGKPQTKPRSCNAGLLLAKGDLIVIYDAEDRPDPDQLRLVAGHFTAADDRLACVQAKLMVSNAGQSFITRQFALEYCLRYELTLPGLARLGLPIPLGGTSNHFRTRLLRELGGWDAWNVTEDADLGMRCSALGYRVEVADSITYGEMPHRVKAWTKQRTRWLKGFMLTALVHTRNPARTWRTFGRAGTATMLTFMVGTPLLYLAQSVSLAIWASGYHGLDPTNLPVGYTMTIVQSAIFAVWTALVVAAARKYKLVSAVFAPLLPAYWVMHWTASWRGLYQLIRAPFLWEKTAHPAVAPRI
jgi:cellulose synthase/poly-beta-1,6-N-acetylglucosamine synthase-like glycosyltransferase